MLPAGIERREGNMEVGQPLVFDKPAAPKNLWGRIVEWIKNPENVARTLMIIGAAAVLGATVLAIVGLPITLVGPTFGLGVATFGLGARKLSALHPPSAFD